MSKQEFTLSIYTENHVGLINKIATMFTRRKISIHSLNTSPSEIDNIYRFTLVVIESAEVVQNLVKQIEKLVDVFKVFCNTNDEIIWQQMALYKVPTQTIMKDIKVERVLREFGAKAVVIREDYTIFEVTGQDDEINKFLNFLHNYNLKEFVKSARIAIIRANEGVHKKVIEMDANDPTKDPINNEFLSKKTMVFNY
ncbi:acetolactate synthase small subunit [Paucihalobacter ruber]|jgi:acetolactate synthase-1/3 small subunit|uniref:Acetolactate synthase small subunit n=1 Tax=Paucihalobacter ruber TaxID=2567861 RepID=A0A506PL25_9FLAO|nr:acetolactate synthase small subunit [Paucihalobacter ruber]TPV32970.1 acetolactate synthase small subunit [Paucihalobacter ruber]